MSNTSSLKITWPLVALLAVCLPTILSAQYNEGWELKKNTDGIQVYYREAPDSPIKELRITMKVEASLSTIIAVLYDVEAYPDWVYSCVESKVVKHLSDKEMYYYNLIDFPWPMSDRDLIAYSNLQQDPHTHVVTTHSTSAHQLEPERDGLVRISLVDIKWIIHPHADGTVDIDYYLKSDPGGNIPKWMVNFALDHGPTKTMKAFRERLEMPKYQNRQIAFIKEKQKEESRKMKEVG